MAQPVGDYKVANMFLPTFDRMVYPLVTMVYSPIHLKKRKYSACAHFAYLCLDYPSYILYIQNR